MRDVLATILEHCARTPQRPAVIDGNSMVTYGALGRRVAALAGWASGLPAIVGVAGRNSVETIAVDLALTLAGRTIVPLPEFFSPDQLRHVVRDSGLAAVVCEDGVDKGRYQTLAPILTPDFSGEGASPVTGGHRRIIYTSGTTGQPKGVILGSRQLGASIVALARAVAATQDDRTLAALPYALLLEQIASIYTPLFGGAAIVLCPAMEDFPVVAHVQAATTMVLVPDMLSAWVHGLERSGSRAPSSLRFVAVGGAAVPPSLAERAWRVGIPAHEGYGLSECGSVVAFNHPGERVPGTVGKPLPGVQVSILHGEIVVSGETVMDGYLGGPAINGLWRTGDGGHFDDQGNLVVEGRLDDVIVTPGGRNIHPEWIESMLLADSRIGLCALVSGAGHPVAVLVPSSHGADWFAHAAPEDMGQLVAELCAAAPDYARPGEWRVMSRADLLARNLLTTNGRPRRRAISAHFQGDIMNLSFFDQLEHETAQDKQAFMAVPVVVDAVAHGAGRGLYLDFLASAYHHVKHTCPLLGLALSHCGEEDAVYRVGLLAYLDEEKGHEEWILDDIQALGGDPAQIRTALAPLAVRMMVAYAYHAIERINPYALLGMVHVLEGMSVALARAAATSTMSRLGLTPDSGGQIGGFSYLISHGHLDEEHVMLFAGLLARVDTPERRRVVIQAAKDFYRLYGDIFRELGKEREMVHAA